MNDRPPPGSPRGILDSMRALLDTVLSMLHDRAELFTTEIEEELGRLVRVILWSLAAVFAALAGASFFGVTILLAAPAEYRVLTAAGLGLVFLAFAWFGYLAVRRILQVKPRPFDASLRELEKDREHLRGKR